MKLELDRYNLDTEAVAKKLGYHPQYVRFLAASGKIPALKRGREWRFDEGEILKHFESETKDALKGKTNGRRKTDGADTLLQ